MGGEDWNEVGVPPPSKELTILIREIGGFLSNWFSLKASSYVLDIILE